MDKIDSISGKIAPFSALSRQIQCYRQIVSKFAYFSICQAYLMRLMCYSSPCLQRETFWIFNLKLLPMWLRSTQSVDWTKIDICGNFCTEKKKQVFFLGQWSFFRGVNTIFPKKKFSGYSLKPHNRTVIKFVLWISRVGISNSVGWEFFKFWWLCCF